MVFLVVAVGRIRHAGLRDLADGFVRRAGRTVPVEVREVAEAGRRGGSPAETRRLEGRAMEAAVPPGAQVVALTRAGTTLSSRELAGRVDRWRRQARTVAFLIGGTHGIDGDLLARSDLRLALSSLTIPHELARIILLEQLYRSATILDGHPYHKGD